MLLTLSIQTFHHQPYLSAASVMVDTAGGSIGRGPDNTLVLEDPGQHISRVQVKIYYRDGGYFMLDHGRNASALNGTVVAADNEMRLHNGDLLGIGAYIIAIGISEEQHSLLVEPVSVTLPPLDGLFDEALDTKRSSLNLLDQNLFGLSSTPSKFSATESQHVSPEKMPLSRASATHPKAMIPDDYDPLMGPAFSEKKNKVAIQAPAILPLDPVEPVSARVTTKVPANSEGTVLNALLHGMCLPHLKTEKSPEELAHLVGMMLREAMVSAMALLSRHTASKEPYATDTPLKLQSTFEAALTQMFDDEVKFNVSPVTALKHAFDAINTYQLGMEIQIQRMTIPHSLGEKNARNSV